MVPLTALSIPLMVGSVLPLIPDLESEVGSGVWRISISTLSAGEGGGVDKTLSPCVFSVSVPIGIVAGCTLVLVVVVGRANGVGKAPSLEVATASVVSVAEGLYGRSVLVEVLVGDISSVTGVLLVVGCEPDEVIFGSRVGEGRVGG